MAKMSIQYEIKKHATCLPSNVLAQDYGAHIFNVKLTSDTDNGNLVKIGDWESLDVFKEDTATEFTGKVVQKMTNGNWLVLVTNPGDAALVYNVPIAPEDWTHNWTKESNMYNPTGTIARVYELRKWDRFELSEEGFSATPEAGKEITGVADKKLTVGE